MKTMTTQCAYCNKKIEVVYRRESIKNHFCNNDCKSKFQQQKNEIRDVYELSDECLMIIDQVEVLIDRSSIELVQQYKWHAKYDKTIHNYYIEAVERKTNKRISLHRLLTNCPENMTVDHINRITTDNCLCNLKICTQQENSHNKGSYKNNKSGYKNIYWNKVKQVYVCEIRRDNKVAFRKSRKDLQELVNLRNKFLEGGDNICQ